jgi:hypothetical protein
LPWQRQELFPVQRLIFNGLSICSQKILSISRVLHIASHVPSQAVDIKRW